MKKKLIGITEKQEERILKLAKKEERSFSEILRNIIDTFFLNRNNKK